MNDQTYGKTYGDESESPSDGATPSAVSPSQPPATPVTTRAHVDGKLELTESQVATILTSTKTPEVWKGGQITRANLDARTAAAEKAAAEANNLVYVLGQVQYQLQVDEAALAEQLAEGAEAAAEAEAEATARERQAKLEYDAKVLADQQARLDARKAALEAEQNKL